MEKKWRRDLADRSLESFRKEREAEKGVGVGVEVGGGRMLGGEDECYSDSAGLWEERCAFVRAPVRFCVFTLYILCVYSRCVNVILCAYSCTSVHNCRVYVYTHTHTHTHTHSLTQTHSHTHKDIHTYIQKYIHTYIHTHSALCT
jgi:hypothetical protein